MILMRDPGRQETRRRTVAIVAATLVLACVGAFIFYEVRGDGTPPHRVTEVVTLKLVEPPPPPPPPPPPQQPPPEPVKAMEQPKLPDNKPLDKPKDVDKPPPQSLGLDAKGGPGSDAFGLAGRPGGASLIGDDGGGGGFGRYAAMIQSEIQRLLQSDEKLRSGRYRLTLALWLSPAGKPERVKIISTTGSPETDALIEHMLAAMPELPQAPPQGMPQPVNLRINAQPPGS